MTKFDITANTCITYKNLIDRVLSWLTEYTSNVPNISPDVPMEMLNGVIIDKHLKVEE